MFIYGSPVDVLQRLAHLCSPCPLYLYSLTEYIPNFVVSLLIDIVYVFLGAQARSKSMAGYSHAQPNMNYNNVVKEFL